MIIFNNLGHCYNPSQISIDPIVWVDASDSSYYTLDNSSTFIGNELLPDNGSITNNNGAIMTNLSGVTYSSSSDGSTTSFVRPRLLFSGLENGKSYKFVISNIINLTGLAEFRIYNGVDYFIFDETFQEREIIFTCENNSAVFFSLNGREVYNIDSFDLSLKEYGVSDVLTLDNKGTLGGAMTLNGAVKFANSGFESWSNSDFITRDLVEPFINENSFTVVNCFSLNDLTSGSNLNRNWFLGLGNNDNSNFIEVFREDSNLRNITLADGSFLRNDNIYSLGLQISFIIYDKLNRVLTINNNNESLIFNNVNYSLVNNLIITILKGANLDENSGENNPYHEFRLYDRTLSLTEIQGLQTELNNKYTL